MRSTSDHPMQIRSIKLIQSLFFLSIFLFQLNGAFAQAKVTSSLIKQDTLENFQPFSDSLDLKAGSVNISSERHAKSGNLAMLLSAVVPGAGQVYAHRYYTIPIIWGFGAYFASTAIKANQQYEDFRGKFTESVRLDTANHLGNSYFSKARDFYHNQRDEFILYLTLTYLLNIIDAYVGATLYDFDVSDDLGGSANIRFRIPLH
jgi:hypothetical protein